MKNVFVVSVILTLLSPALTAHAITIENVSVSSTGGIVTSDQVQVYGSEDASAEIKNSIRSDGTNANVRIDIRTNSDDVEHATSVSRVLESETRMEVRAESGDTARVSVESVGTSSGSAAEEEPEASHPALERFTSFFANIFDLFIFW